MKSQKNESTRLFSTKEPTQQYYIRYLTSNQGGGLRYSNVATNAAIFPGRLMLRHALIVLSYCIFVFNFGCGSRI